MYYQSPSGKFFNKIWYKRTYNLNVPDNDLLKHYNTIGYKSNLNPSLYFNTKWYKETYKIPDNMNPLEHFYRCNKNHNIKPNEKCKFLIRDLSFLTWPIMPYYDFIPLKDEKHRINLLLPAPGLSGGPATIYLFADFLSKKNYNVRIIFIWGIADNKFFKNLKERINIDSKVEFASLYNKDVLISYDDIFIVSAWWTVYPLKFILGYLNFKKFFWFIQENELLLHAGDETYAKALSCYNMKYYSFINTSLLFDDLKKVLYPFTNQDYCSKNAIYFEPAFNTKELFYIHKPIRNNLKIIFYSRDANAAKRNCVKLLHNLLKSSFQNGLITKNDKVYGFGQKQNKKVILTGEFYYQDLGFLDLDKYYKLFREADILISFQIAPHPSYPPLEMSFCNGLTIHTNFSNKTQETISRYTDKIIMCDPNINSLLTGMEEAVRRIKENKLSDGSPKLLNTDWEIPLNTCYDFFINKCDNSVYH